jgi:hypothetical protein
MKNNDHSFTFLTAIILAGVIAACLPSGETSPASSTDQLASTTTETAATGTSTLGAQP